MMRTRVKILSADGANGLESTLNNWIATNEYKDDLVITSIKYQVVPYPQFDTVTFYAFITCRESSRASQ